MKVFGEFDGIEAGTAAATVEVPLVRSRVADFLELTKPRIAALVLVTTITGFVLAADGWGDLFVLLHAVIGTALAAGGANALNQYLEREADARMVRTAGRPIPTGRIAPADAWAFGVAFAVAGIAYLLILTNPLTASLAALTVASYVLVYTPLKRRTPWCTAVGAVPGALPPVIGWAAARGRLDFGALLLFLLVFVWQIPHFWSIAWLYRQDYRRGGFPMLPVVDASGRRTARQVVALSVVLVIVSLAPWWFEWVGRGYLIGAGILGATFVGFGAVFAWRRSPGSARSLAVCSITYLPMLLGLLVLGR